jgi:hypothetical protein
LTQLIDFAFRSSLLQGHAQLVSMVELIEQLLGRSKVPSIISEQRMAKEVLLEPTQAFRVLRVEPLL